MLKLSGKELWAVANDNDRGTEKKRLKKVGKVVEENQRYLI